MAEEEKESKSENLKEMLENIQLDIDSDKENRDAMLDDLRFCTLDQWPAELRAARENDPNGARPCLTIDKINQYITQVVNDMRQNRPSIKIRPVDDSADIDTAKIYQGLVRHIEDKSSAYIAYETAGEWITKTGRGYFRITTEYVDDSFDQEIRIKHIPDAFSVYLGPHTMPDGSDARRGTILEQLSLDEFKRQFPKAKHDPESFNGLGDSSSQWRDEKTITIAEHFQIESEKKELLFLDSGEVVYADKFDGAEESIVKRRTTNVDKVKWYKLTGAEILEERDWAGKYIPIVEVIGKESIVEGKRVLWGLVRPAKDNLRMYNYWASAITEKIGLSPKAPFIIAVGQDEGLEGEWQGANRENRPTLHFHPIDVNGNMVPAPQRIQPSQMEGAMVQMMGMIENDVRASLGMYKASVGDASSQQSGRALLALQRESDTGTFHFADNLARSICHAGRIIADIIPKYYDTKRIIRILGEDGESKSALIDPSQQEARRQIQTPNGIKSIYNLGVGKYDVTVTVGPSYNTKRMEAAQVFTELARSATDPGSAAVLNYLAIKNSDVTSSDEAVVMLKGLLPPNALPPEDGQAPLPPQVMQRMQQMDMQMKELAQENQQLKSGAQESQMKLQASMRESQASLAVQKQKQDADIALAREKASVEIELKRQIAQADYDIEQRKLKQQHQHKVGDMDFQKQCKMQEMNENETMSALPQMIQALQNIEAALQQQTQVQMATLDGQAKIQEALERPKSVSIGQIQKDKNGKLIGATVNSTIQ